jgi:hypothetical protein
MAPALRIAVLALTLLGGTMAHAALEITAAMPLDGVGVARGVVIVRCIEKDQKLMRLSRGAVLDLGSADTKHDVVLTAAHGLIGSDEAVRRRCVVVGAQGRPYEIETVRRARGGEDFASDWAVLLVKHPLGGDVGRLAVARASDAVLAELVSEEAPVRLLLRQAPVTEGDCHLLEVGPPFEGRTADLMMYSCRIGGVPGLSGSPILIAHEGRALVMGIHLGWVLQKLDDGRFHVVSMGRPIDAEIAAAISDAAAEARR